MKIFLLGIYRRVKHINIFQITFLNIKNIRLEI